MTGLNEEDLDMIETAEPELNPFGFRKVCVVADGESREPCANCYAYGGPCLACLNDESMIDTPVVAWTYISFNQMKLFGFFNRSPVYSIFFQYTRLSYVPNDDWFKYNSHKFVSGVDLVEERLNSTR